MALSEAERKRRYRAQKQQEAKALVDEALSAVSVIPKSFPEFLQGDGDEMDAKRNELMFLAETMDSVGMDFPDFSEDEDPEWTPDWYVENRGVLGRAERMVDGMIDCAKQLAELINEYKLKRVGQAIEALMNSDLSDPDTKKLTLAKIVKLEKVRERLSKEVRHSFKVTSVKGE